MKSNMNCLTKKSLFFIILSTVCNTAFSADVPGPSGNEHHYAYSSEHEERTNECKTNVHLVFSEDIQPYFAFKFAMFSLSEPAIGSMKSAEELLNHFRKHETAFHQYDDDFKRKHQDMFDYFRVLLAHFGSKNNTSTFETIKKDIAGYFKFLVSQFNNISQPIQKYAMSPFKFCKGEDGTAELMCRRALSIILRKSVADTNKMEEFEAFINGYLNCNYLDFTYPIFSGTNIRDKEPHQFMLDQMVTYFRHLLDVAHRIVEEYISPNLFPTVEEYCSRGRRSN